ncbi:hypothetical protein KIPB_005135 [Kipferlia bialata]|uniref:Uncharacterized protein n=1 Tax=Kipferlia bialata TaxID=797122 RepID=A0A9K3CWK5_9EUKA|nr:hypothetical protein KIPB_005135 [Kipferlia bialata]|eukprot:g5135.t1
MHPSISALRKALQVDVGEGKESDYVFGRGSQAVTAECTVYGVRCPCPRERPAHMRQHSALGLLPTTYTTSPLFGPIQKVRGPIGRKPIPQLLLFKSKKETVPIERLLIAIADL